MRFEDEKIYKLARLWSASGVGPCTIAGTARCYQGVRGQPESCERLLKVTLSVSA